MTEKTVRTTFESYLAAFAEPSPTERERLLRSNVAETVDFSNPGVDGRGLDSLLTHVARFQEVFPGGYFRINWLRQQHGRVLAEWTQFDRNGSPSMTAHSYARLNEDGLITHFAGFWEQ